MKKVSVYFVIFCLCAILTPKKIVSKTEPRKNHNKEETSTPKEKKRSRIMDIMFKRARKFDARIKKLVKNIKKEIRGEDKQKEKKRKAAAHSNTHNSTKTDTQEISEQDQNHNAPLGQDHRGQTKKEPKAKTKSATTGKIKKICTVVKKTGKIMYLIAREIIRM